MKSLWIKLYFKGVPIRFHNPHLSKFEVDVKVSLIVTDGVLLT